MRDNSLLCADVRHGGATVVNQIARLFVGAKTANTIDVVDDDAGDSRCIAEFRNGQRHELKPAMAQEWELLRSFGSAAAASLFEQRTRMRCKACVCVCVCALRSP
jgi:hypothetical protein